MTITASSSANSPTQPPRLSTPRNSPPRLGPAAHVHHSQVLLSLDDTAEHLGLLDGSGEERTTSNDIDDSNVLVAELAADADEKTKAPLTACSSSPPAPSPHATPAALTSAP
ncbi:hypothetical protein [Streptomyces sp. NPDC002133]|uniref:hypothetical protein n=1 Tax=Streptomyces sp. NPDC002133 TaxID=3154409 RepID=UPI00332B5C7A